MPFRAFFLIGKGTYATAQYSQLTRQTIASEVRRRRPAMNPGRREGKNEAFGGKRRTIGEGERCEDRMDSCAVVFVVDSRLQRVFGLAHRLQAAAI